MDNEKIKNDSNNTIGKNIRRIRIKKGIGQTELVRRLQLINVDIIRESLVKTEPGVQHIKLEQLRGIKDVLKVKYDDLLE